MDGDVDIANVANLMGEPARASILIALMDGRALSASTLAIEARVSRSTVSNHLTRLVNGGLIDVETSGRHRYFRLASPLVAAAVEALARLAPTRPVRSLGQALHAKDLRRARTCYDHLAGRLGVSLFDTLLGRGIIEEVINPKPMIDPIIGAGRFHSYVITNSGLNYLATLGIIVEGTSRRPLVLYCLDWSEQRPHLGGALGSAFLARLFALQWLERSDRRVVKVTEAGRNGLYQQFGLDIDTLI